jgi:PKD repeat protein
MQIISRLSLIIGILIFQIASAQTIKPDARDGFIYFKIKDHVTFKIISYEDKVAMDQFSFLSHLIDGYGIKEIKRTLWMSDDEKLRRTFLMEFTSKEKVDELIKKMEDIDIIEYAEIAPIFKLAYVPNDPYYSKTNNYQGYTLRWNWYLKKINAEQAWDIGKGSATIKVAIVDNAVFTTHPDLSSKISSQRDAADVDNDANPPGTGTASQANYEWSHGTHVAGLVGANSNNNVGIASIGHDVSIMAVKIARSSDGQLIAGYEGVTWAANNGAHVINMSWGSAQNLTTFQNTINAAYNKGCVLVAAAGNDGQEQTFYPAGYTNVIAVASTDGNDKKSSFSNYGAFIDVCAPGGNDLLGSQAFLPLLSTTFTNCWGLQNSYGLPNTTSYFAGEKYDGMQGTSMASPIVAGLAGLMRSLNPNLTNAQIRNCIESTCTNISSLNSTLTGKIGAGRINAQAAMQCVQQTLGGSAPVADFTANVTSINTGGQVQFTDQSTNTPTSWQWSANPSVGVSFNTATTKNPTATFANAGTYSITLTAANANGNNSVTKTSYIIVSNSSSGSAPVAAFTANVTSINTGGQVQFTDQSTNTPTSWQWSANPSVGVTFNTATTKNPTAIFANAGTYSITLTATNANGNNSTTKTNYIVVNNVTSNNNCDTLSNITTTDTLVFYGPVLGGSATGYISGNNSYGDKAKAEYYAASGLNGQQVTGAVILFYRNAAGLGTRNGTGNGKVTVEMLNKATSGSPGTTVLATKDVSLSSIISTPSVNNVSFVGNPLIAYQQNIIKPVKVTFNTPVTINGDFFINVKLPTSTGDTAVIFMNTIRNTNGYNTSWEQWSDNSWVAYSTPSPDGWGISTSFAILPTLCPVTTGLNTNTELTEKINLFPNPAGHQLFLYAENSHSKGIIKMIDILGKTLLQQEVEDIGTMTEINTAEFNSGTYFITVTTGNKTISKKLIISH